MNIKKNTYTITAHPNNVVPADNYTFKETMTYDNMFSLFENLIYGNWQATNGVVKLNYAYLMAKKETEERYNINNLNHYLWNHAIYIENERIYNPIELFAFNKFIKYLYEEETDKQYYVIDDGRTYYRESKSKYKYYYSHYRSDRFKMNYKKAKTFICMFSDDNLHLQLLEA